MIKITDLEFSYPNSDRKILNKINMEISDGGIFAIIGHTGCGKSTLIRHMNGLLSPNTGTVFINGIDISKSDIRSVRKSVGIVFQYPEHQLFAETVFDDIAFGPKNLGISGSKLNDVVYDAMEITGLDKSLALKSPFHLSGGEMRRVAIAGIIAMKPQILILDEPAAGLDPGSRRYMFNMLYNIHSLNPSSSVIFISHSMDDAASLADKIFVMRNGAIITEGSAPEVFADIDTLYSAGLGLPQCTELAFLLQQKGLDIPISYNISDTASNIAALLSSKSKN